MTIPPFSLSPPPAPSDPRRHEWDALLWDWLRRLSEAGGSSDIIAGLVFGNKQPSGARDVADAALIEATQVYANHAKQVIPQQPDIVQIGSFMKATPAPDNIADSQKILVNQIFGG